jgi:hypothetical protein
VKNYEIFQENINSALEEIRKEETQPLRIAEKSVTAVRKNLEKLREYIKDNPFKNEEEEIYFFKEIKPPLLAKMIFYRKVFVIESGKPAGTKKVLRRYLKSELDNVKLTYRQHRGMYEYIRSKGRRLDKVYFLREKEHLYGESPCLCFDQEFHTSHDIIVAEVMAYELVSSYLATEIFVLKKKGKELSPEAPKRRKFAWTGNKSDVVEFVYALHKTGVVDNGLVTIKELMESICGLFNIEIPDYSRMYHGMRGRKKVLNPFLERLLDSGNRRMEEADEREN